MKHSLAYHKYYATQFLMLYLVDIYKNIELIFEFLV